MEGRASSGRSGSRARNASIASLASSRSRLSGSSFPYAREASMVHVWTSRSPTFALRSSSTSSSGVGSARDSLIRGHLLGEDLFHRRALLVAGDLPLGGVALRDCEPRRRAELVRDRLHP